MENNIVENIVQELKEKASNADRTNCKGFINDKTSGAVLIDSNGDVTISPSKTVQYKMKYNEGQATEVSMQSNTITNRKNLKIDELTINNHKINPQLWELTDMKRLYEDPTSGIGNLTMYGTVLVKTWEPFLQKWVLIRRPIRTPIFSNYLPLPDAPEDMDLQDATDISEEILQMRNLDDINKVR
jgi:hypothetical protein